MNKLFNRGDDIEKAFWKVDNYIHSYNQEIDECLNEITYESPTQSLPVVSVRFPSLTKGNLAGARGFHNTDPMDMTHHVPVTASGASNTDFDGDQGHVFPILIYEHQEKYLSAMNKSTSQMNICDSETPGFNSFMSVPPGATSAGCAYYYSDLDPSGYEAFVAKYS